MAFKAANNGSTEQNYAGRNLQRRAGVSQDYISSYMWFCLAAESGNEYADRVKDFMADELLTRSQLKKAMELLDNYRKNGVFANN